MKNLKSFSLSIWHFFFPLLTDPAGETLRAYLPAIIAMTLLGMLATGRDHDYLLGLVLVLMTVDRAIIAAADIWGQAKNPK